MACLTGDDIPIEQRAASEVVRFKSRDSQIDIAPVNARTYNPAFDMTPASLITAYFLDQEVYIPSEIKTHCMI